MNDRGGNKHSRGKGVTALYIAVQSGDIKLVLFLLKLGALWSAPNSDGNTPLCEAARTGFAQAVHEFLFEFCGIMTRSDDQYEVAESALFCACENGHVDIALMLLQWGVSPNTTNKYMQPVLRRAIQIRHAAIVQLLLDHGASANDVCETGLTALHLAVQINDIRIIRCICTHFRTDINAVDRAGRSALFYAAEYGYMHIVRELLRAGIDVKGKCTASASSVAKTKAIQELLAPHDASAMAYLETTHNRQSARWAMKCQNIPVYLQNGAFYQSLDPDDESVIHIPFDCFRLYDRATNLCEFSILLRATQFWLLDCIPDGVIEYCHFHPFREWHKVALECLCAESSMYHDLCFVFNGDSKNTLSRAIRRNRTEIVRFLAPLWACESTYQSITTVAARHGNLKLIQILHEHGFPWDKKTCAAAARGGHLECLKYAQENGCEWDASTLFASVLHDQVSCLAYAYKNHCLGHKKIGQKAVKVKSIHCLKFLVTHKCYGDDFATCAQAAWDGSLNLLKYLHENNCRWDRSTMEAAARAGKVETLRYAIVNGCPNSARTAYYALRAGSYPCFYLLVELGVINLI